MARPISEIYLSIVAEKNNQPTLNNLQPAIDTEQQLLSDITSPSKVADWRIWCFIITIVIWAHENLWDIFKAEVDTIVSAAEAGTARWYQQQALLFQFGDAQQWINNKWQYATIDPTKQIIKYSASIEIGGVIYIKVAKANHEKLDSTELAAFQTFMKIKWAGTYISIINYDADLLKLGYNIVFDPLVLASDGSLITDQGVTFPVEDAINAYIAGIVWNGTFNLTKIIDAIQSAQGVVDVIQVSAQGKAANGSVYNTINQNYQSVSGHMIIDPANPLSGTLSYTANV